MPMCTIDFDGGHAQIFSNYFEISPEGIRLNATYYKKEGDKNVCASSGNCYLKHWMF